MLSMLKKFFAYQL